MSLEFPKIQEVILNLSNNITIKIGIIVLIIQDSNITTIILSIDKFLNIVLNGLEKYKCKI